MRHPEHHIFEFTPETLREWCVARGMKAFRATQILEWVYQKGVVDPELMTNLSKRDREVLAGEMTFLSGVVLGEQAASDGTWKVLVEWGEGSGAGTEAQRHKGTEGREGEARRVSLMGDGGDPSRQTECVMIPAESVGEEGEVRSRRTACISSQVGCPVGCRFCASGLGGLDGNLSAGRIVEQAWVLGWREGTEAQRHRGTEGAELDPGFGTSCLPSRITNIVFMGMGEPLANFRAVMGAVRTLNAPWGMGISARRITISTVGLPRAIERLAEECELPVTLALSLHAPNDELRRALIPWAEYTSVEELLGACRKWFQKTGREITLEYTLLRGVNDRPRHAEELARVARTLRSSVNLIRYNEVGGLEFRRPRDEDVLAFQRILQERGVKARIRASRGRDIAAACGQLRHEGVGSGDRGRG